MKYNFNAFPKKAPFKIDPLEFAHSYIDTVWKWIDDAKAELTNEKLKLESFEDQLTLKQEGRLELIKEMLGNGQV